MRSSAGPVRTLVLLVCVLLQACYGSSDPNKETCYSRQHRGVWVNGQVALTNTGIVMEARDMPSEKDCILNCCSEDVKPGLRCNLVVFRPRNQSISENCLLFHCPGERDCPLSVAASGVNTYNIFKGLTHPATKLTRTTTKPAPAPAHAHTTTTQATTKTPTTPLTTTAQTLSASVIDFDATAYGLEEDFTESSLPVLLMTKSTLTSIQPSTTPTRATTTTTLATTTTTPPTTTTTQPTTTTTQPTTTTTQRTTTTTQPTTTTTQPTTTTTQPTTTTTQRTTTTTQHTTTTTTQHLLAAIATSIRPARPLSHPSVKVNRPRKPSKPQRGQEAHSVPAQLTSTRAHAQVSTAPTTTTSTMSSTATITSTTTTSTMSSSTTSSRVPPAAETKSHFKDRQFPEAGVSKPEKPKISWMMWKNSLVAIVVITLIFLVFLLALAGRKAMESFDRRHYTRLELNDLHYEV